MCLIIIKKVGQPMPSEQVIANGFKANGDGFGLAYNSLTEPRVRIIKGAMTLHKAHKLIAQVPNPAGKNIIFHFRLATAGTIKPANCHPYPIDSKAKTLQKLRLTTEYALAHNGIIGEYHAWQYDVEDHSYGYLEGLGEELTDTQQFIQDYLVDIGDLILKPAVQRLVASSTDSKFAILTPKGIVTIGYFEQGKGGLLYSNGTYKSTKAIAEVADSKETSLGVVNHTGTFCDLCGERVFVTYELEEMKLCAGCYAQMEGGSSVRTSLLDYGERDYTEYLGAGGKR